MDDFENVKPPKRGRVNRCKKPSRGVTKEILRDRHKALMEARKLVNAHNRETHKDGSFILANISVNHPNYGDSPAEHEERKRSEKSS